MTQNKPTVLYTLKLFLLALVGYCYIFSVPAIFLALLGLLLWHIITGNGLDGSLIYIELVLLIIAGSVVRSLLVKVTVPEFRYVPLEEKTVPKLFETIREIRRAIGGPQVHKVVMSDQFELVLTPVPRLGLFGWSRNELEIGIPLMHGLTPAQFRALLTHELGHFSGTRLGTWIYHARVVWRLLQRSLNQRQRGGALFFNFFFRRYVDYFCNYSLALARAREYKADRFAAETTSPEVTAGALIRFAYGQELSRQEFEEGFTVDVSLSARFAEIAEILRGEVQNEHALSCLEELLSIESDNFNTHPALKYRLQALGQEVRLPTPISESAADVYFGDSLGELTRQLEINWEERGAYYRDQEQFRDTGPAAEIFKRAQQADTSGDNEAAVILYRETLRFDQDHANANLSLGRILLSENNAEGIHFLERAMDLDVDYLYYGSSYILHYFKTNDDLVSAVPYQQRLRELERIYENADAERSQVSFVDSFTSNDLPEHEIAQLRQELAKHPRIREAYLVRKEVQYLPEKPFYVMGVVLDQRWFDGSDEDLSFIKKFPRARKVPLQLHCFALNHRNRRLGKIIRNVTNSLIYQRASINS